MRQPWTVRVAGWSARHRWPVFGLWFVLTIGLFVASLAMGGTRTADAVDEDASEDVDLRSRAGVRRVRRVGQRRTRPIGRCSSWATADGTIDDPPTAARSTTCWPGWRPTRPRSTGPPSRRSPSVVDPRLAPAEAGLVSPDRSTVRIAAAVPGDDAAVDAKLATLRPFLDETQGRASGPPDPLARRLARQRGHPGARHRRSRRVAAADDPADVPHPARRVRGGRRGRRAAGPGRDRAARRVRGARHLQPGDRSRSARTRASSSCSSGSPSRSTTRCS